MTSTTEIKTEEPSVYHVRCKGSNKLQQALQDEQARRFLATRQRVSLMDIAAEWLEERAAQVAA